MSIALYRKYRPKKFSDVTNQNHIKTTLQNELSTNKLAHAYLFCGPRGTGKTTMARLLAKSANCLQPREQGEACNECENCQEILENRSLDIMEIDAASHTGVENVRENIINNTRFTPAKMNYKVFIIDEVHMLSVPAFNALLKILEEPPEYVIFILATTEIHKLPATIVSRCQRFDFKKIVLPDLVERLNWIVSQENVQVDKKVLEYVARQAGGCVRDAESLLEQILSLGEKNITVEQAELIIPKVNYEYFVDLFGLIHEKNTVKAVEMVNRLMEEGIDLEIFIKDYIEFLRQCLLYKLSGNIDELATNLEKQNLDLIFSHLQNISFQTLSKMIECFMQAKEQIKQSPIIQLPLELKIVELTIDKNIQSQPAVKSAVQPEPQVQQHPTPTVQPENNSKPVEITQPQPEPERVTTESELPVVEIQDQAIEQTNSVGSESDTATLEEDLQPKMPDQNCVLDIGRIKEKWPKIVNDLKQDNYSLTMALKMCEPVSVDGEKVQFACKYDLQRNQVDNIGNKGKIEQALAAEFGQKVMIDAQVDNELNIEVKEAPIPIIDQPITQAEPESEQNPQSESLPNTPDKAKISESKAAQQAIDMFGGEVVN